MWLVALLASGFLFSPISLAAEVCAPGPTNSGDARFVQVQILDDQAQAEAVLGDSAFKKVAPSEVKLESRDGTFFYLLRLKSFGPKEGRLSANVQGSRLNASAWGLAGAVKNIRIVVTGVYSATALDDAYCSIGVIE